MLPIPCTCKFCGVKYTYFQGETRTRPVKDADTRKRSRTLCPDCYAEVTAGIRKWCELRAHRPSCLFVEKLYARKLSDQAILAVLVTMGEVCPICWDGDLDCVCGQDI